MNKKLYRSTKDKVLAGVCGGLGEYFDVDPTLVRLACGLLCLYAGTGLLAYVVAACIIPVDPRQFLFDIRIKNIRFCRIILLTLTFCFHIIKKVSQAKTF